MEEVTLKTVIFDLDGTLADCEHRRHFIRRKKKDFDAFYAAMGEDGRNEAVCELAAMYAGHPDYFLVICTGRPEKYRAITKQWLLDNEIEYHHLYMRPDDRLYDKDCDVKRDMLRRIEEDSWTPPTVAVDDRDQVVKMWREEGLTCLQVVEGNF